jgi:hypothetical protein
MALKRKTILTIGLCCLSAGVFLILLTVFYFYLPSYVESRIIPQFAEDIGISDYELDVRRVGLHGADLGILRIGRKQNPALMISSVQIDYDLKGLYQHQIKRVVLSGMQVYGEFKNGKFSLRGLELKKILAQLQSHPAQKPEAQKFAPLFFLTRLEIRNADIICEINGHSYRIPFEIDLIPADKNFRVFNAAARLYPCSQKISTTLKIDLTRQAVSLDVQAADLNLGAFEDVTGLIPELILSGKADLKGSANLHWAPFDISAVRTLVTLREADIFYKKWQLQNARNKTDKRLPFQISIHSSNSRQWEIEASSVAAVSPLGIDLSEIKCSLTIAEGKVAGSGRLSALLSPSMPSLMEPLPFSGRFNFGYDHNGNWQFGINNKTQKKGTAKNIVRLRLEPYLISGEPPLIEIFTTGKGNTLKATYKATWPDVRLTSDRITARVPAAVLEGTADLKSNPRFEGLLRFAEADLIIPDINAGINGAQGSIPLKWPAEADLKTGRISAETLRYQNVNLGSVSAMIRQTATGLSFEGKYRSDLIPALSLQFSGNSKLFNTENREAEVQFEISPAGLKSKIELATFLPAAQGMTLSGRLWLNGKLTMGEQGTVGWLNSRLADGSLRWPDQKIAIEGIQTALSLPELPKLRSAPGQQIFFDKAEIGGVELNQGKIEFQMESPQSLFIEKSRFKWCDGTVDTQAMRISPAREDYSLVLYCDRLNLAEVLAQFGAANATGKGTVNGRIPLRYKKGRLSFDDGFLFSTPGEGGKIHVTGTEMLTAGIPPDTPQYVQMEIAGAALSDYEYNWAKLNITTEGEDLLIGFQLDGKPAKPLPFVYKKELGGFAKVEADVKGSVFQGIHLDVNFRLPLDKILYYRDIIHMME